MIEVVSDRVAIHAAVHRWRLGGSRVGFVPTMGALHEGHLALVRAARAVTDRVVASVFVNPIQFGPGEDFEKYPRNIERDTELLERAGAHLVYAPTASEMYPAESETRVVQTRLPTHLCGPLRPGHFEGVLTVVLKLFNQVRPDVAFFGQKDYQQTVVLRRMLKDLDLDLDMVISVQPTVREIDGLAMSSRNAYLSPAERIAAPLIKRALNCVVEAWHAGTHDAVQLVAAGRGVLDAAGCFRIQYFTISDPETLAPRTEGVAAGDVVALAAILGRTRLIDNVLLA